MMKSGLALLCGVSLFACLGTCHSAQAASDTILRVGHNQSAVDDSLSSAEALDKKRKAEFMRNFDQNGATFTVSLPPYARPIKVFGAKEGTSFDANQSLSMMNFGFGMPTMGMSVPSGVHPTIAPDTSLTMKEDVPRIIFESCVRMKLNSGLGLDRAFPDCQEANAGYKAPAIPSLVKTPPPVTEQASADLNGVKRTVTETPLPPAAGATGWAADTSADGVKAPGILATVGKMAGDYAGADCDVSRNPSVMLSQECLKRDDALLANVMQSAGSGVLHVPAALQPGHPSGEKHSLLANIPARPIPQSDVNFASVDDSQIMRREMQNQQNHAAFARPKEIGSVSCEWAVNGTSSVGVQYGHGRSSTVKACIRSALLASNISDGTIGITLKDLSHGVAQTLVECHRRSGNDTCGIVR